MSTATWFQPNIPAVPPVNGQYDFFFDYNTGNITIYELQSGAWVSIMTINPANGGLQGPQGPQGPTGPQGPQGIQGIQGPVGLVQADINGVIVHDYCQENPDSDFLDIGHYYAFKNKQTPIVGTSFNPNMGSWYLEQGILLGQSNVKGVKVQIVMGTADNFTQAGSPVVQDDMSVSGRPTGSSWNYGDSNVPMGLDQSGLNVNSAAGTPFISFTRVVTFVLDIPVNSLGQFDLYFTGTSGNMVVSVQSITQLGVWI